MGVEKTVSEDSMQTEAPLDITQEYAAQELARYFSIERPFIPEKAKRPEKEAEEADDAPSLASRFYNATIGRFSRNGQPEQAEQTTEEDLRAFDMKEFMRGAIMYLTKATKDNREGDKWTLSDQDLQKQLKTAITVGTVNVEANYWQKKDGAPDVVDPKFRASALEWFMQQIEFRGDDEFVFLDTITIKQTEREDYMLSLYKG